MPQIFEMKLRSDPFRRICSGEKTVEYRLQDEKRSLLNKGDYIRFTEIATEGTERTVLVEIVDIITAESFVGLEYKLTELGFLSNESLKALSFSITKQSSKKIVRDEKFLRCGIRLST